MIIRVVRGGTEIVVVVKLTIARALAGSLRCSSGSAAAAVALKRPGSKGSTSTDSVAGRSFCVGAGIEIPAAAGRVIAAPDTRLWLPELAMGLLPGAGGTATIAPLDLTDGTSISRLAGAVAQRWQRLDILVLNAATLGSLSPLAAADGKELNQIFTLNVLAQQALLAAFEPLLRQSSRGRVLALSSSVARTPRAYWGAYGASKAALENLVTAFGEELKNISAVRTAIIDPGATRTQMRARAYPGEDAASVKPPEDVATAIVQLLAQDFESTHFIML